MSDAIASHGTLVYRQPLGVGGFDLVGELGDITPPPFSRPSTETTPQQDTIDSYVIGVLKRGEMTFPINYVTDDPSHDETDGIISSLIGGDLDGWKIEFPDAFEWIFSGYVTNFAPAAPAREGALTANVTIRPTGPHKIGNVDIG